MHIKLFSSLSIISCAIALAFVGAAACKTRTFDKSSDLKSAFLPAHYGNNSFLKNVESKGKVVVDLYYLGNPPPSKDEIEHVKTVLTSHLQAWLSLMDDHPEWRLKSKEVLVEFEPVQFELPPNFKMNATSSTGKENLKFIYTRDPEVFFSKVCSLYSGTSPKPADRSLCYSTASPLDVIIVSGPLNRGHESTLKRQHWAILHEVGHLFGLGDVYNTSEVPEIKGRPTKFKSVMYGDSEELTDDDKLGLWAQYNFLKTGKRDCSGFGNRVTLQKPLFAILAMSRVCGFKRTLRSSATGASKTQMLVAGFLSHAKVTKNAIPSNPLKFRGIFSVANSARVN